MAYDYAPFPYTRPPGLTQQEQRHPVVIVGAGPAGMECARALGQRGYEVVLAEAATQRGGRVLREAALPE